MVTAICFNIICTFSLLVANHVLNLQVNTMITPVPAYRTDVTGKPIPESLYEEYEEEDDEEEESDDEITVPLTISMVVLLCKF